MIVWEVAHSCRLESGKKQDSKEHRRCPHQCRYCHFQIMPLLKMIDINEQSEVWFQILPVKNLRPCCDFHSTSLHEITENLTRIYHINATSKVIKTIF